MLTGLGFMRKPNGLFGHPDHTHSVDILFWPIVLGNEEVNDEWDTIQTEVGGLQILSPTQCVKDRLAGFYNSVDRQSLDRAVAVCLHQEVDMDEIRRWSEGEYATEKLKEFLERDFSHMADAVRDEAKVKLNPSRLSTGALASISSLLEAAGSALTGAAEKAKQSLSCRSGEITAAGTLTCVACKHEMHFKKTGRIPPCPKCHKTEFEKSY